MSGVIMGNTTKNVVETIEFLPNFFFTSAVE